MNEISFSAMNASASLNLPAACAALELALPSRRLKLVDEICTGDCGWFLTVEEKQGQRFGHPLTLRAYGSLVTLRTRGGKVNFDRSQLVGATLSLGMLEMPIADLLSLREGSIIEFEKPARFEGVIRVAGAGWAVTEAAFSEEKIILKIKALIPPPQETIQRKRRT